MTTGGRYVALGSSYAAGPGVPEPVPDRPRGSGRSTGNYAHLVAAARGLDLVDVTFSGATTAHLLDEPQRRQPPQLEALTGSEELVTVTVGGNDVGFVPLLMAASAPRWVRPVLDRVFGRPLDREGREAALREVLVALRRVGSEARRRAPDALVVFVDYVTVLPPDGTPAPPLEPGHADLARFVAQELRDATSQAAADTGCEVVRLSDASVRHHAWSAAPWCTGPGGLLRGRTPFHPNAAGMRAASDLVIGLLDGPVSGDPV